MKTRLLAALLVSSFTLAACPSDTPSGDDDAGEGSDAGDAGVTCLTNEIYDASSGRCVPDFGGGDAGDVGPGEDAGDAGVDSDVPCVDTEIFLDRDGDNYGVDDEFEAFLTDAGLDLNEAQISVSESFGEFRWNWGECEGGLVTATFPSAQRVLIVQDMFCAG